MFWKRRARSGSSHRRRRRGQDPSRLPAGRSPRPSPPPVAVTTAHLIFTCLIEQPLAGSRPPKHKHRDLQGRYINQPACGRKAGAGPCQALIRCSCRRALPPLFAPEVSRAPEDRGCLNKALSFGASAEQADGELWAIVGRGCPLRSLTG